MKSPMFHTEPTATGHRVVTRCGYIITKLDIAASGLKLPHEGTADEATACAKWLNNWYENQGGSGRKK